MGDVIEVDFGGNTEMEFDIIFTPEHTVMDSGWTPDMIPEDFQQPVTEETLFGWSVKFMNSQAQWVSLTQYFSSEEAALMMAEACAIALDFDLDIDIDMEVEDDDV